jgi:hypothetical protein
MLDTNAFNSNELQDTVTNKNSFFLQMDQEASICRVS